MDLIEKMERMGRLVLCLAVASACVVVPLAYTKDRREKAAREDRSKQEEVVARQREKQNEERSKQAEEEKKRALRLPWTKMGPHLYGLDVAKAEAGVTFTNLSPKQGFVCLSATATNPNTKAQASSLPACQAVSPYSTASLRIPFARGDMTSTCPETVKCSMQLKEEPDLH